MSAGVLAAALLLALLIDRYFGEPPVRLHPVVWMGNYLGWAGRRVQQVACQTALGQWSVQPNASGAPAAQGVADYKAFWLAAVYWTAGVALFTAAAWGLEQGIGQLGAWVAADVMAGQGANSGARAQWLAAAVNGLLLALLLKPMLAWAMLQSEV